MDRRLSVTRYSARALPRAVISRPSPTSRASASSELPIQPTQTRGVSPANTPAAVRFADAEALLQTLNPDLVSICTPTRFHCELTLLALHAGAHVVCEKPMAMTVAEAEDMDAARRAAGKLGAVNFSYRNAAAFRYGRETNLQRQTWAASTGKCRLLAELPRRIGRTLVVAQ